ncbi:hypothetical protein P7K49_019555 [Saguinus oedipus]|uniref:Uncharacterized protein n=1 Tax=Saguinus oedipus TaxID=9490 RepID=A0ABQ9UZH7_SAGOE|nr:hypothetical protein P7K49_019555 [Saguinus oedipus]
MDVLPTGGGRPGLGTEREFRGGCGEARLEGWEEEAVPAAPPASAPREAAGRPRGFPDSWDGDEDPEPGEARGGRTSRTASLVSGLLTELYSCAEEEEAASGGRGHGGRRRRRDSLDSSTEASGSDVVLGGRGSAGDSRVLQELQERPSQRHQMLYLRQKGEGWVERGPGTFLEPRFPRPLRASGLLGRALRHCLFGSDPVLRSNRIEHHLMEWTGFPAPPPPISRCVRRHPRGEGSPDSNFT